MPNYIGEIRIFPITFAPSDFLDCNGQWLSGAAGSDYEALYSILQGQVPERLDGQGNVEFQVPDLAGRVPFGFDGKHAMFATGGEEAVALVGDFGQHTHSMAATTSPASTIAPGDSVSFATTTVPIYTTPTNLIDTGSETFTDPQSPGALPHENMAPSLALRFCICAFGIYPSSGGN